MKSAVAILAGFLLVVVLSVATDALVEALGLMARDPAAMGTRGFLWATAYRTLYTLAGGALTARLSPRADFRDVLILAGLGLVAGLAGIVAWFATPGLGPLWYAVAIPVTGVLATLAGGRLVHRTAP